MTRHGGRLVLTAAAVLAIAWTVATPAQQVSFRGGTDSVYLPTTVTDHSNHLVGGLDQDAFHVFEDGVPQPIQIFSREPQPIAMSLLVDTSTSMERRLGIVQEAAIGFVRRLGPRDVAQVIAFDSQAQVLQTFTSDHAVLEKAIRGAHAGGSTALYMAVYIALSDLERVRAEAKDDLRRQAIVLLSDGEDTSSLLDYDQVRDMAKRSKSTTVYAIGLKASDEQAHGFNEAEYVLRTLTQDTGGRAYFITQASELNSVYQQIADELANQYMIGYNSTNHKVDGAWRRVTVTVDRPGAIARTRSGYFGPQQRLR
jgi:Ca-activated chloride channel family protein